MRGSEQGGLRNWKNNDMELLYRAGRDHGNAYGMSRLPDMVELCRGYKGGSKSRRVTMWGCRFCVRLQAKFEEEVNDLVPLAVREIRLEPGGWVEKYTKEELRKVQLEDDIVWKVLRWLELGGEPQREELLLADPDVKYFWRFKENLAIRGGVLKYKWMSRIDRWLLAVPEIIKGTVLEFCHSKCMACHMGVLLGPILKMEAHRKAREILEVVQRRQKKYYNLRKRATIYEVEDVVLKKNNADV